MELSTGYVISSYTVNGVQYYNVNSDKGQFIKYSLLSFSQPGTLNNTPAGSKVVVGLTPYNHAGITFGTVDLIPETNTTLSGKNALQPGETAITENAKYNFTLQTKLDRIVAIFQTVTSDGTPKNLITTKLLITESIIQIIQDIINEITNLQTYINSHVHSAGGYMDSVPKAVTGNSGVVTSNYTPASKLVQTDYNYIGGNGNVPQCYTNNDGAILGAK